MAFVRPTVWRACYPGRDLYQDVRGRARPRLELRIGEAVFRASRISDKRGSGFLLIGLRFCRPPSFQNLQCGCVSSAVLTSTASAANRLLACKKCIETMELILQFYPCFQTASRNAAQSKASRKAAAQSHGATVHSPAPCQPSRQRGDLSRGPYAGGFLVSTCGLIRR